MDRPQPNEYNPFFERYISLAENGDLDTLLITNLKKITDFFNAIPASKHDYAYADGKWTIKQVAHHITDTERVMQYRALTVARGDLASNLPGMDENLFAAKADVNGRTLREILDEFAVVRQSSRLLFANIGPNELLCIGLANGHPITPRALAHIILGHPLHHINVVRDRYL